MAKISHLIPMKWSQPVPGPHLRRDRLLMRLGEGLQRRLTLLSAGPGFGKTTLLADFLAELPLPFIFYQADEADGDLTRFLHHLAGAVRAVGPVREALTGGLPGVEELLASTAMPISDPEAAAATLIGDLLGGDAEGLVICIDDWHRMPPGSGTTMLLHRLAEYLPGYVHLYLAGRGHGDLPLERWRISGRADEITAADLRFDEAEAAALFRELHGLKLSDGEAAREARAVGGWAAGLYLRGRSLRTQRVGTAASRAGAAARPDSGSVAPGDADALQRYLDAEVMRTLPADRRAFLLATAVLENLSASLCDRLRDTADSAAHLAALEAEGFFLNIVDPAVPVYRCHGLLRDYLLGRLATERGTADVREQHRRAAALMTEDGDLTGAIAHLMAAGETEGAADLLARIHEFALWDHSLTAVAGWLQALPPAVVEQRPPLLVLAAEAEQMAGHLEIAAARLEQACALLRERGATAELALAEARLGHNYLLRGDAPGARRLMERALLRISPAAPSARAACLVRLAMLEWMAGALERCDPLLREAHQLFRAAGDRLGEAWALHNLAIDVHVARGEYRSAAAEFHQVAALCAGTVTRLHCICLVNLGSTLSILGQYAEGRGYLQRALAMADALTFEAGRGYALAYLAWSHAATGDCATAEQQVREALELEARLTDPQLRLEALASKTLLCLRRGDGQQALEAAEQHLAYALKTDNSFYLATSWAHLVIIHCNGARYDDARQALAKARELLDVHPSLHTRFWIRLAEVVAGLAIPGEACPESALADLLALADHDGYENLLLTEGVWADRLLQEADRRRLTPSLVSRLKVRLPQAALDAGGEHGGGSGAVAAEFGEAGPAGATQLRLWLLGGFTAELDGKPLPAAAWRGRKPRELCKLLALHLDQPLLLDECLEQLWPRLDQDAAYRNFRVTLHWLRRAIGEEHVAYGNGRCGLDAKSVWCDVAQFRHLARDADERWRTDDIDGAAGLYARSLKLYRGDLLEGEEPVDWELPHVERLREMAVQALTRLAVAKARNGRLAEAAALARQAVQRDPGREATYRLLMRLEARSGLRVEVARVYRACAEALRRELGTEPTPTTRKLYERLAGSAGSVPPEQSAEPGPEGLPT